MAIVEVVKYNGSPDIFAWKYPNEELGTWTQLIVNESQEVVLLKGGKALDVFQSGRHTLDTANIPVLRKIIKLPFGGKSPFSAEIWFINKLFSLDIKWGTATPILLQDPKYDVPLPLRSNGKFGIRIEDSRKFLTKLVGTMSIFDKRNIVEYFRGLYITKLKDSISEYIINKEISVFEINSYIDEISDYLKERIQPILAEYGVQLINFYVNDISFPEDNEAGLQLKKALSKRAEMDIIGYTYKQERSFDTLEGMANNSGGSTSELMGAGIGLGIGAKMGGLMGATFGDITNEIDTSGKKLCPRCNTKINTEQRFCGSCGYDTKADIKKNQFTCASCGSQLDEHKKYCPECGNAVEIRCPNCNAVLKNSYKFCPECGNKLTNKSKKE